MARVLVVDDDQDLRKLLERVLVSENFEAICAENGLEALKIVEATHIDLVVTDLIMPDKEGLEVIREIRVTHPDIKLIAMTGGGFGSAATYLSWAKAFGVSQTLAKPFSVSEFIGAVRAALG